MSLPADCEGDHGSPHSLVTVSALVGLLVWSLTGESDAEHQHMAEMKGPSATVVPPETEVPFRRAA